MGWFASTVNKKCHQNNPGKVLRTSEHRIQITLFGNLGTVMVVTVILKLRSVKQQFTSKVYQ
jgi:hypothetical protein